jgi:hypothetical protein
MGSVSLSLSLSLSVSRLSLSLSLSLCLIDLCCNPVSLDSRSSVCLSVSLWSVRVDPFPVLGSPIVRSSTLQRCGSILRLESCEDL